MHADSLGFMDISRAMSSSSKLLNSLWSTVTEGDINIRSSAYINILSTRKTNITTISAICYVYDYVIDKYTEKMR
jgi:hypothetical protein